MYTDTLHLSRSSTAATPGYCPHVQRQSQRRKTILFQARRRAASKYVLLRYTRCFHDVRLDES